MISKRNKEQIEKLLNGHDIALFTQYVEHEQPVAQLSMAKWVGNGSVRLPEDKPTVDEALKICRRDKLDPMQYAAPGEIVKEWRDKNRPDDEERDYLSPDNYPDVLTNKQDIGYGVTVYDVANTRKGQRAVRDLMNSHLTVNGKYYNCWCLLYASGSTGKLSSEAWSYWNRYNGTQKKVAFKDGKIMAFCASSEKHPEWWDLSDVPHGEKIPVEGKIPDDKLGRSSLMEIDIQTGEAITVGNKYSGNKKNGLYREWNKDDVLVLSVNYKRREYNGLCESWHSNGRMSERSNWKEGKINGLYEEWYESGRLRVRINFKNGRREGLREVWVSTGQIIERSNYKDHKRDGLFEEWFANGQIMGRCNYKDGKLNGLYEAWHENGQIYKKCNYKDEEPEGLYESWYENGQIEERRNYKDGKLNGLYEVWQKNGQIIERNNYKSGARNGLCERWHSNGQMSERSNWKDGELNGLRERWYDDGQIRERANWKDGEVVL